MIRMPPARAGMLGDGDQAGLASVVTQSAAQGAAWGAANRVADRVFGGGDGGLGPILGLLAVGGAGVALGYYIAKNQDAPRTEPEPEEETP